MSNLDSDKRYANNDLKMIENDAKTNVLKRSISFFKDRDVAKFNNSKRKQNTVFFQVFLKNKPKLLKYVTDTKYSDTRI